MRRQGGQAQGRVRKGRRKKLAKAAEWAFKPKEVAEHDEWVWKVAKAFPDKKWLTASAEQPPRAELWHGFYWEAWRALCYDRTYVGQFAVEKPIFYTAIDRYAARNNIKGEAFDLLLRFVTIIDIAYLERKEIEREEALAAAANRPPTEKPHG